MGTASDQLTPEEEAIADALYRATREFDRAKRLARDLRGVRGGRGPRIRRGSGRAALVIHLTRAVSAALHDPADDRVGHDHR